MSLGITGAPGARAGAAAGRARRILVLAGDADGNLGDRAIRLATCELIREAAPDARITVLSRDPARVLAECGADSVPPGPAGLVRLVAAVRASDLVLCGGGGLLQDDDSLVKTPYWALRLAGVRLLGRQPVGFSLGVGPLGSATGRLSARLAFATMREVTARDPPALALAQALSRRPVRLLPDPALALRALPREAARGWLAAQGVALDGPPLLGVALRRWFPPQPRLVPSRYRRRLGLPDPQAGPEGQRLVERLATALDAECGRSGARILFLPTYTLGHEADDKVALAVQARMRHGGQARLLRIADPRLYKAVGAELAALLGGRMHPMILAAGVGTPVVGLAYNPKFAGLAQLLGIERQVVEVQELVRGAANPLPGLLAAAIDGPRPGTVRAEACAMELRAFLRGLLA